MLTNSESSIPRGRFEARTDASPRPGDSRKPIPRPPDIAQSNCNLAVVTIRGAISRAPGLYRESLSGWEDLEEAAEEYNRRSNYPIMGR